MTREHLSLGAAIDLAKEGRQIARRGWNGSGMFVFYVEASIFLVNRAPLLGIFPEGTEVRYRAHLDLVTPDGTVGTWAPSNSDAIATDWYVVN